MKKYIPLILLLVICLGALMISTYLKESRKSKITRLLPIIGNKSVVNSDTVYHTVSSFEFVNQLNTIITDKDVENKNYVVEYFFTTCQSICPVMNKNMMKVAEAFKNDSSFRILSHTVKPEEDSVSVLLNYAKEHNADPKNWWFLTGSKKELYAMARQSYLMNNEEGNGDSDDFIHSQLFALVDKNKHLRGFYDGTKLEDVDRLIKDVEVLKKEQSLNDGKSK